MNKYLCILNFNNETARFNSIWKYLFNDSLCWLGGLFTHFFQRSRFTYESGRHVRMRLTSLCHQLQLVKMFSSNTWNHVNVTGIILHFYSLGELVRHGENGLVFDSAEMLTDQLLSWFHDYPNNESQHQIFRKNLLSFQNVRWHSAWVSTAWPRLSDI